MFPVEFPELGAGQIETIDLDLTPYSTSGSLKGQFNDQNGNEICEFAMSLQRLCLTYFENEGVPETELSPVLSITNFTNSTFAT